MSETPSTPDNTESTFIVTVSECSAEQAACVINERISPDEDYGFPYEIGYTNIADRTDDDRLSEIELISTPEELEDINPQVLFDYAKSAYELGKRHQVEQTLQEQAPRAVDSGYLVGWQINVDDADSPEEAALTVWKDTFMRTRATEGDACVFDVTDANGTVHVVDLAEIEDD